jgi:hypothetical protein
MSLPIDLPLRTMTSKVSLGAHERLKKLAGEHGARMSDVLSACLLHMPEAQLAKILAEQKKAIDNLPKSVKGLMRNMDKLSEAEKKMLRDLLGEEN